jgi:hypothetical protein
MKSSKLTLGVLTATLLFGAGLALAVSPAKKDSLAKKQAPLFQDVRTQTKQFIAWSDSIRLTPEQQKVKEEVLSSIPATCCSKFSMLTCCCACNMAKTIWGLSNHMLVHEGADAKQLRAAVLEWTRFIGPKGFTGDACFKGGCSRPFADNGCGGMDHKIVIF